MPKSKVITVHTRAEEYKNEGFYVFDATKKILMCKYCNVRIKWERKDTCDKHCKESEVHKRKKTESREIKRQVTINETLQIAKKAKNETDEFIRDTTKAFMEANIPLEKLDSPGIRKWMNKYIKGAGDLPQANTCRKNYIPVVRAEHEEKVKAAVREKKVVIHCDETTNRKGEAVFIILFRVLPAETLSSNLYVASVSILQNADSQECCQAINSVIMKYEIQYNNIVGISSDSARYMTKCVRTLKGLISDDLVHVQCWAHKLDIISKFVPRYLTHLNECVSMTKKAFQNTRKRKHRYLKFLEEKYRYADCRKAVKLFPMPVMTRWGSWIDSALYTQEYLTDLVEYFRGVEDTNEAVKYFQDLRNSEQKAVFFEATFVKEHCVSVSELITLLEGSQYPTAHKLIPKLDSLLAEFDLVRKLLLGQQTTVGLNQLSGERKAKEESKIKGLAEKWHTKLDKMMKEDPSGKTFQAISKLFYLPNVLCAEINVTLIDSVKNIPLLSSIPQNTFLQGYGVFQRQVKECVGVAKNDDCVVSVLEGLVEDHREFAVQCLQAVWFPTSNVDSERGFSAYTKILTDCRTNLRVDNIETMLGLYFGDV